MSTTLSVQHRSIPLKTYLTRLLWLCILPLLVLAVWLAYDSVQTLRAGQRQAAEQTAENFANSIDQYLRSRIRGLNMIAISPLLDEPAQWPILYQQAQGYQKSFDGHVVLSKNPCACCSTRACHSAKPCRRCPAPKATQRRRRPYRPASQRSGTASWAR